MTLDQVLLLVAVNGFVLAVMGVAIYFLFPASAEAITGLVEAEQTGIVFSPTAVGSRIASWGDGATKLARRLDVAGNPPAWPVTKVYSAKLVVGLALGVFGFI